MSEPSDDKLPRSKGTDDAILTGKILVGDACPVCGAMFACPTGDVLTCLDCYSEFKPSPDPI